MIEQVHPGAPPFFVIHGDRDTLAPVEEARDFTEQLRKASKSPVVYAELKGAQHAFDLFCSPRTSHMLVAALQFLDATHAAAIPNSIPDADTKDPHFERHIAVRA